IPVMFDAGRARDALGISKIPAIVLTDASQNIVWRQNGFAAPAKLGLSLRRFLGSPKYAEMSAKQ
ncbi:MAG: hypothetical protein ACRD5Z_07450, partial [Bryobacteraceae bacterium]